MPSRFHVISGRAVRIGAAVGLGCVLMLTDVTGASDFASTPIMRVDQDWEAVLIEPGPDTCAPQFHTVMSPFDSLEALALQADWNFREDPEFIPGGLQLLAFAGEDVVAARSLREDPLSTVAETITWTQRMATTGSWLRFEIVGNSTSWGAFGGSDTRLWGTTGVANLNAYRTDLSVGKSWVSYGANRVQLLRIREVRFYDGNNNLLSRDTTSHVVYQQ